MVSLSWYPWRQYFIGAPLPVWSKRQFFTFFGQLSYRRTSWRGFFMILSNLLNCGCKIETWKKYDKSVLVPLALIFYRRATSGLVEMTIFRIL